MKSNVANAIKYNKILYSIYYNLFNAILRLLRVFIRIDNKLIFINSYGGRKYDDSPKEISTAILEDPRFTDYKIKWAFHEPSKYNINGVEKVKTDTIYYFITALKSRVWITNSSFERGLKFKNTNTIYFNTWHGTPLKKMGSDIVGDKSFHADESGFDIMMSQGSYETEIFSRVYNIPNKNFLEVGLPRNDVLANYTDDQRTSIRNSLGLPSNKLVVLYCPTFREYEKDKDYGVVMAPPMDLKKWAESLSDNYVLLVRAHYEVSKVMSITDNDFVRDMTSYPCLNDLLIASDILVSDYSSVFFDYSITNKPMLHFAYDYDKYALVRGVYFDIREKLNGGSNEDELIELLLHLDMKEESKRSKEFRSEFVNYYGNATKSAVDWIAKNLGLV